MPLFRQIFALACAVLLSASCAPEAPAFSSLTFTCSATLPCALGFSCVEGVCIETVAGHDSGPHDAGLADAGVVDAGDGPVDAGLVDGGLMDAGPDAGMQDAGPDAGMPDAGMADAGQDSGMADAGWDAGVADAGPPNEAPVAEPAHLVCSDEVTTCTHSLRATDDGAPEALTWRMVTPAPGWSLTADGMATFAPTLGVFGTFSMEVVASDGLLDSAPVTVTVTTARTRECATIAATAPAAENGPYLLDPDGPSGPGAPFWATCDLAEGYTLAMKIDGADQTWAYDSPLWTDAALLRPESPGLDPVQAKLASATTIAAESVRLVVWADATRQGTPTVLTLENPGAPAPLVALVAAAPQTHLGARAWRAVGEGAPVDACWREGFSVQAGTARARIGMLHGAAPSCADARLARGVGLAATCGASAAASGAGALGCTPDETAAVFVDVYVRGSAHTTLLPALSSCSAHRLAGADVDGWYMVDADGAGPAPAREVLCLQRGVYAGWMLWMTAARGQHAHATENGPLGTAPCRLDDVVCKPATDTTSALIAQPGHELFAFVPQDPTLVGMVFASRDNTDVWPQNLWCDQRANLAANETWILTGYQSEGEATRGAPALVGTWQGQTLAYPSVYPASQVFFAERNLGARFSRGWRGAVVRDTGYLWHRKLDWRQAGVAQSCLAHLNAGHTMSGRYRIDPDGDGGLNPFFVYCDMQTDGGGWTVIGGHSGADGEPPLTANEWAQKGKSPLEFGMLSMPRQHKQAVAAGATETLFVRPGHVWLRLDRAVFRTLYTSPHFEEDAAAVTSDGARLAVRYGWNVSATRGGDFGVVTTSFDHHNSTYPELNSGCNSHLLYSYSASAPDGDAGYDVNTALGAWGATHACHGAEGGLLAFYTAVR